MIKRYWARMSSLFESKPQGLETVELIGADDIKDSFIVWHKVEDGLPRDNIAVITIVKDRYDERGYHYEIWDRGQLGINPEIALYWAYLPKPPKE